MARRRRAAGGSHSYGAHSVDPGRDFNADLVERYRRPEGVERPSVSRQGTARRDSRYSNSSRDSRERLRGSHSADVDDAASERATQYRRTSPRYSSKYHRRRKTRKIVLTVVIVLVCLFGGFEGARALYYHHLNNELSGGMSATERREIDDALTGIANTEFNKPFYMMLIGSDKRVNGEVDGQRSDTNIVARVDPTSKTITLVSIPRDTMIDLDGYGRQKFNAAYEFSGAAGTIREASQLLGVDITHVVEVDFDGLSAVVDAIGGVDVHVEQTIDDPDAGDQVIEAGDQHLDGTQALIFARSRAYVDGDYSRMANQRELLMAIVNKCMTMPASDLLGVVEASANAVTTDMSVQELQALVRVIREGEGSPTIYSVTVPSTPQYVDGISYVVVDTNRLTQMMRLVSAGQDPSAVTDESLVEQQAASAAATSASATSSSGSSGG